MVDETKVVEETTQTETPSVTVETTGTPTEKVEKTFTQQEIDKIINSRFAREKAAFEKQLTEQKTAIEQEFTAKQTELEKQLTEKDNKILGYQKGIATDKLDEALVLANLKLQKTEGLTLEEALTQVTQEFPNLVVATKNGAEIKNQPKPTNAFWTEEMKRRYPSQWAAVEKNQKK